MFPPVPEFEGFPIPIEIEWEGRKRLVEVRMEQLPTQPVQAVPVCSFLDAPEVGEWLLVNHGNDIYTLGNPYRLLWVRPAFLGSGGLRGEHVELNPKYVERLRQTIEDAINADKQEEGVRVLRVVQLAHLPHPPNLVFMSPRGVSWCDAWKSANSTAFASPEFDLNENAEEARLRIQTQWEDTDSNARFAWEWANRSDDERMLLSFGWTGNLQRRRAELELVMRWILICQEGLWSYDSEWEWWLNWDEDNGGLRGLDNWLKSDALLSWQEWLWSHFFSGWRGDWLEHHPCVKWFWTLHTVCTVNVSGPPTMHERLEARLQLRAWLQANPPDRIELLPE